MAGTVVISEQTFSSVKKVTFAWTSNGSGAADGTTTKAYDGEILRVVQVPGTSGTQPSNLYDVTIVDSDGLDLLFTNGADISNAANSQKHWLTSSLGPITGTMTIHVTNAGSAKTGSTIVYIR